MVSHCTSCLRRERQSIPDVPAVYFVRGVEEAVERAVADAAAGLYDSLHLNFTPSLPAPLMQKLAAGAWWQPVSSMPPEMISGGYLLPRCPAPQRLPLPAATMRLHSAGLSYCGCMLRCFCLKECLHGSQWLGFSL